MRRPFAIVAVVLGVATSCHQDGAELTAADGAGAATRAGASSGATAGLGSSGRMATEPAGGVAMGLAAAGGGDPEQGGMGGSAEGGAGAVWQGGAGGESDSGAAGQGGASSDFGPVHGVVKNHHGVPMPDCIVRIADARTVTDAQGKFSLSNVAAVYDLTVISWEQSAIEIVDGLTTRKPELEIIVDYLEDERRATAQVKLSGGAGFPLSAKHSASISVADWFTVLNPGSSGYDLWPSWDSAPTLTSDVVALQWLLGPSGPASYTGFARKEVTLQDGKVTAIDLGLTDPPETLVSGHHEIAGEPLRIETRLWPGGAQIPLHYRGGAFSVLVPEVELPVSLYLVVSYGYASSVVRSMRPEGDALWQISTPRPLEVRSPTLDAHVTMATVFSWTPRSAKAAAEVRWGGLGVWSVHRVTQQTEVTLPNLWDEGIYLDTTPDGYWRVGDIEPVDSIEEALHTLRGLRTAPFTYTTSEERNFQPNLPP